MSAHVVVIGAGMGGLAAAARLAQFGLHVQLIEARSRPGGLASRETLDGFAFDAGPYVLLDRPGLEWVFRQLGSDGFEHVKLRRIEDVYEVASDTQPAIRIFDSLDRTAESFEDRWPGAASLYKQFVERMWKIYQRLQPLQRISNPGLASLIKFGAWRDFPFLLRSLASVLRHSRLPSPIAEAIGIWTHVAGQGSQTAPSPLALVPALIHFRGAWYPENGIGAIPEALAELARRLGVRFRFGTTVRVIRCNNRRACGIETMDGEFIAADAIVANSHGIGTYLELLRSGSASDAGPLPRNHRERLGRLPLQSPGVCAYLAVRGPVAPPYLRFHLPRGNQLCRLLVTPAVLSPKPGDDRWQAARLLVPIDHKESESGGEPAQRALLDRVLAEQWWQSHLSDFRVVATRTAAQWGRDFHLYRDSMNPVMTASLMRSGRLPHRSPLIDRLYLTGSSTHPGQWVSFCAVSGILAADALRKDLT